MELLQEYSELKKTIDYHMDRYYNQDEPEISDYEYDKLMIRLKEIEKNILNGLHLIHLHRRLGELSREKQA